MVMKTIEETMAEKHINAYFRRTIRQKPDASTKKKAIKSSGDKKRGVSQVCRQLDFAAQAQSSKGEKRGVSKVKKVAKTATERILEDLRKRLLDLSIRNRLLNYKHPRASSLRVIDELPNQIVKELGEGKEFRFLPVAYPTEEKLIKAGYLSSELDSKTGERIELKPWPTEKEWAEYLELATDHELPKKSKPKHRDQRKHRDHKLQTLEYPEQLSTRLRYIRGIAESSIREKGANILYLIVGFLEWFEREDSQISILSPLVTLPVQIKKGKRNTTTGFDEYGITIKDEGLITNSTLNKRLEKDFGLSLPEYKHTETKDKEIEIYFDKTKEIIEQKPRWKIRRYCTLGLLDFSNQVMYRDLDISNWPEGNKLIEQIFSSGRGCPGQARRILN